MLDGLTWEARNMHIRQFIGSSLILLAISSNAFADTSEPEKRAKFLAGIGYTFGGDTLADYQITPVNGSGPTYVEDLSGGAGLILNFGGELLLTRSLRVQGLIGFHADHVNGINGEATYRRAPVELLAHWRATDNWWIGGGIRKATHGAFDISRQATSNGSTALAYKERIYFSTAAVLEGEYVINKSWGIKLRAVRESGRFETDTEKFNADHMGLIATYYFN